MFLDVFGMRQAKFWLAHSLWLIILPRRKFSLTVHSWQCIELREMTQSMIWFWTYNSYFITWLASNKTTRTSFEEQVIALVSRSKCAYRRFSTIHSQNSQGRKNQYSFRRSFLPTNRRRSGFSPLRSRSVFKPLSACNSIPASKNPSDILLVSVKYWLSQELTSTHAVVFYFSAVGRWRIGTPAHCPRISPDEPAPTVIPLEPLGDDLHFPSPTGSRTGRRTVGGA